MDERILLVMGAVFAVAAVQEWCVRWRSRRRQRSREDLRHITGAQPWWGRR